MKRSTKRRGKRWSEKPRTSPVNGHAETSPMTRHDRDEGTSTVLGPYESAYDISLGYSLDRSIVLP